MASFKSYNNTDPNEIMKFIDSYQKQLYPDTPSTDFTDILQKQDAQEAQSRQANYQREIADTLPETTDTLSATEAIMKSARKYGQADQLLKAENIKDEEELNKVLTELGLSGGSDEEITAGYKKALMGRGKIKEALTLDGPDKLQTVRGPDGTYILNNNGTAMRIPGMTYKQPGQGGDGFNYYDVPNEDDPEGDPSVVVAKKNSAKDVQMRANGGIPSGSMAEFESRKINDRNLAEAEKLRKAKEEEANSYVNQLLRAIGVSDTSSPDNSKVNKMTPPAGSGSGQPVPGHPGYVFTGNVDAQGRQGIRRK